MAIHNNSPRNRWISSDFGFQNPSKENSIRSYSSRTSKLFGWLLLKSGFALKINAEKSPLLNRKSLIKFINSHKSTFFGDANALNLSSHTQSKKLKEIFNARITNPRAPLSGKLPESHGPAVVTGAPIQNPKTTDQSKAVVDNPKRTEAAVKIQSLYRGYLARKELKALKKNRQEQISNAAAVKIQSRWRGVLGRKMAVEQREKQKEAEKDQQLLNQAKVYLDDPVKLRQQWNIGNSWTPLYLPSENLVTLRQITVYNREIAQKTKQGINLCKESGYQDLVVPRSISYKDYLISEWLPQSYNGARFQIGLYHADRESFTDAIEQLTKFVCRTEFGSLMNPSDSLLNLLYGRAGQIGQYEKVSLFHENGKGKIGLLDFEGFSPQVKTRDLNQTKPGYLTQNEWDQKQAQEAAHDKVKYFSRCDDLVTLFPYHLEEIMKTASEFDPNIESYRERLEASRDQALEMFKVVHIDHLDFIREKNISLEKPTEFAHIDEKREEELKTVLKERLSKMHAGQDFICSGLLGDDVEAVLRSFDNEVFPELLTAFKHLIIECSKKCPSPQSELDILSARMCVFGDNYSHYNEMIDSITPHLKIFKLNSEYRGKGIAKILVEALIEEFVGKEIVLFNPSFESRLNTQCIFW